jgi:hypothetical protein
MKYNEPTQKETSEMESTKPNQPWFRKLSIEEGGIERVTDEERLHNTTKFWNAATFW